MNGKTAVVTGGSKGIGRAISLKLASLGANIVINYNSSDTQAVELEEIIHQMGGKAAIMKADVSKFEEALGLIKFAQETFGSVDILVNNAGITRDNLILRMKEEEFDQVIRVNLKGAFNCIKHATPIMLKQRSGKIINITSVVGITGNAGQANYASAKAGLIGLTKSCAKELASRGINVNAVAPGFIKTEMTEVLSDKVKENMQGIIPLKRLGEPEDVANAVAFLAGEESNYITGQVLQVDGGMV